MTELRQRMIEDMRLNGLAPTTQRSYLAAVQMLAQRYQRPPDQLSEPEIREYFLYLAETKHLARSTINGYLHAIKFLYQKTLQRSWPVLNLVRVPRSKKLPVVLSPQEVWHLLSLLRRPTAKMSLTMMYACGLRASEATHLRPGDIDSKRMVIGVRNGKGAKDRYVPLPQRILEPLRAYWREHRSLLWLFPSRSGQTAITTGSVRRYLKAALYESDINKNVSCHTLRHSYATHLLEKGVDIRVIQALLGHRSLKSTFLYLHLTQGTMQVVHRAINDLMVDL